jgi:hypothetical protein
MLRVLGSLVLAAAVAAPPPAPPASPAWGRQSAAQDEGERRVVGVVTFEGSSDHAAALSRSMSNALRRRGHASKGGRSLQQVQTQLGCTNYEPSCMAKAGELFGSELVIYGTLRADGDVHQLEMFLLDAERGEVRSHVSAAIPEHDLSDGSIENKAVDLLAQLWPTPTTDRAATPFATPPPEAARPTREDIGPTKARWGRQTPIKPWKWAGFGTSAGVLAIGTVLASVGGSRIRQGGPLERELFAQADESLADVDGNGNPTPGNDIDRTQGGDLCQRAEASPPDQPNAVTNRDVATVCRQARVWTTVTNAGTAMAVIGLVGVATFTTLFFVHREPIGARARIVPTPDGVAVHF